MVVAVACKQGGVVGVGETGGELELLFANEALEFGRGEFSGGCEGGRGEVLVEGAFELASDETSGGSGFGFEIEGADEEFAGADLGFEDGGGKGVAVVFVDEAEGLGDRWVEAC